MCTRLLNVRVVDVVVLALWEVSPGSILSLVEVVGVGRGLKLVWVVVVDLKSALIELRPLF